LDFKTFNPLRWNKTTLFLLLAGFILVWVAFISTNSLWASHKLHRRYTYLKEQTRQLQANTKLLKQKIDSLNHDPALIKRIARGKYGMKKKGETIYKIKVIH
jgi:cell division protein FtsB